MSLKSRTVNSLFWSFTENFLSQAIQFIVGIILARLLSPSEFGLIGMLTIFIAISQSFIDSGFSSALIRKKHCSTADYSTVFYYNGIISVILYVILFISSGNIASFFNEPSLEDLIQVLGLSLILNSLGIIQRTIMTRDLDFKTQTRASVIASLGSGLVAIIMAFKGFGVWSLVALTLLRFGLNSILLWVWSTWRPSFIFSYKSFHELFGFGYKLLLSGLIDTIYKNIYLLIIGKFFSARELGYYTRADQFKNFPSSNITAIIQRVSYPALSMLQDEPDNLKAAYKKLIKSTMFITFILMIGLAAVSEPLIISLIGVKWQESVVYLQMLCFVGMMYPLHALNLNILNVKGRSDLFLKLEIIKKVLAVPVIVVGVMFGIKIMIAGMMVNSLISYYLNSYWSGQFINYPLKEQVIDILPSFLIALIMGFPVFLSGILFKDNYLHALIVQILSGIFIVFSICELSRFKIYLEIKYVIINRLEQIKNGKQ